MTTDSQTSETSETLESSPDRKRIKRILLAVLLLSVVSLLVFQLPPLPFYREQKRCEQTLTDLLSKQPENVSQEAWDTAMSWTMTAYANVCSSPDHVSLAELRRFHDDVEGRASSGVDLPLVHWIWQRLSETGSHGKQYCERWEPVFERDLQKMSGNPA